MNKKTAIIISPNYKDYAKKYLVECFNSIKNQDCENEMKIFISDNESTEESYSYLKNILREDKIPLTPFAKGGNSEIIRNKNNDGFAKGNNDAIKKSLEQGFEYIILFNMDTVLAPDCVKKMVIAVEEGNRILDSLHYLANCENDQGEDEKTKSDNMGKIAAVQARLMLYDDNPSANSGQRNKINSLGNVTHFLGFGYAKGYGEEYDLEMTNDKFPMTNEIAYASGAAVLFTREALLKVGLFDEEMWMYNEDQDLGWRLWLAGYKCILAPEAVAYHKYEFARSIKKYYFMDRNRIIATFKNYRCATLLLILPASLIMEIGLLFFSARGGWFKEKINVYKYFLHLKNWRYIIKARNQSQKLRQVKDKDIIKLFSGKIWYQEIGGVKLMAANILFNFYWRIIKVFII